MTARVSNGGNLGEYVLQGNGIQKPKPKKPKDSIVLYLTALGASFLIVGSLANQVWTSPVILKLRSNNTEVNPLGKPITTYQLSLIAGLVPLGALLSPILLTKLCDIIGRKKTLMVLSFFMIIANTVMAFSTKLWMYYVTRFVVGLCMGGALASVSVFLSEISEDHNRGKIGAFLGLGKPIGSLYAYSLGPLFSVKYFTLFCTLPNLLNILCCLLFMTETPYYLASKKNKVTTTKAIRKIRRKTPLEIEEEYEKIVKTLDKTSGNKKAAWSDLLRVKSLRKGFLIAIGLTFLPQVGGISAIMTFAGPMFSSQGASMSGDTIAILIGFVKFVGVVLAISVIERAGRRPLLMLSSLGVCASNFILGWFFYLRNANHPIVDEIQWLPIVTVVVYITCYSLGVGFIPCAMMSELFPSNMKSKTSSVCCCISQALSFLVTVLFPIMNDLLGPSWCMWGFSFLGFLGFLFVYFVVPEIKGKSLIEVQDLLS